MADDNLPPKDPWHGEAARNKPDRKHNGGGDQEENPGTSARDDTSQSDKQQNRPQDERYNKD